MPIAITGYLSIILSMPKAADAEIIIIITAKGNKLNTAKNGFNVGIFLPFPEINSLY